ncbi:MAG: hypothetical protein AABX69_03785, partial [Nanoarchaeota archaeon]
EMLTFTSLLLNTIFCSVMLYPGSVVGSGVRNGWPFVDEQPVKNRHEAIISSLLPIAHNR